MAFEGFKELKVSTHTQSCYVEDVPFQISRDILLSLCIYVEYIWQNIFYACKSQELNNKIAKNYRLKCDFSYSPHFCSKLFAFLFHLNLENMPPYMERGMVCN